VIAPADLNIYTDGSLEEGTAGAGWAACKGDVVLEEGTSYLGIYSTVFQAEVVAIDHALHWVVENAHKYNGQKINILSDSQAAISALENHEVKSSVVKDCLRSLKRAKKTNPIHIGWVRGHADNTGNELADCLAKEGNKLTGKSVSPELPVPYATIKMRVRDLTVSKWQKRWENLETCRISKIICPRVGIDRLKKVAKWSRKRINLLFQSTTGHGLFAAHLNKWKLMDPICKLCLEDDESADHLWTSCPALAEQRTLRDMEYREKKSDEIRLIEFFETKAIRKLMANNGLKCGKAADQALPTTP